MYIREKMADRHMKTTSSSVLDGNNDRHDPTRKPASYQLPRDGADDSVNPRNVQILTKLAHNLSESYQQVKQRQQKHNELGCKKGGNHDPQLLNYAHDCEAGEWQEVKNKLKRKKKLSASLTSVTDSVNQEKRTRIEGIQLNCRGKLHMVEVPAPVLQTATRGHVSIGVAQRAERWGGALSGVSSTLIRGATSKPLTSNSTATPVTATGVSATMPSPRLKRKLQENVQTIQKLNALTEQLRLEINELKSNLITERGAVRVLRAQNESDTRKWKNEVKKLQNTLELLRKNSTSPPVGVKKSTTDGGTENWTNACAAGNLASYEIQRLTNEVIALKEANRALEERKMINCDADRRKAADMRTLKDSYEIRLTQLTKSAKTEISRLLEEIKTKERHNGQLKRELQTFQARPPRQPEVKSRNATTNQKTTNKTTKPKKSSNKIDTNSTQNTLNETNAATAASASKAVDSQDSPAGEAQHPSEVKKLKDIELINNAKNLQNNLKSPTSSISKLTTESAAAITAATATSATHISITNTENKQKLKSLRSDNLHLNINVDNELIRNNINDNTAPNTTILATTQVENCNNLLKTTTCPPLQRIGSEQLGTPIEKTTGRLLGTAASTNTNAITLNMCSTTIADATKTTTAVEERHNDMHEDRMKYNNSDSDSALSSAPPSISPQPPPAGLDTADIWQMIRTYSTDLQKLQKDNEILQKENEQLHTELNLAKEQILDAEKSTLEANNNARIQELMARVKILEEKEHQLSAEADELREQNELLEFRILELEETSDKWSAPSAKANTSQHAIIPNARDVWSCEKSRYEDPMKTIFSNDGTNANSGTASPHSQQNVENALNLIDPTIEELRRRVSHILKKSTLDSEDKQWLQQLIRLVQQLDLMSQHSGSNSLHTASCSGDDTNSLELVKSRISDYSSASSPSSAGSTYEISCSNTNCNPPNLISATKSIIPAAPLPSSARIVATVLPYNSSPQHQPYNCNSNQIVPTNTPTDSPRKLRQAWQSNSLSESGVFVESDFLSDFSQSTVCTQTDFEDENLTHVAHERLQRSHRNNKVGVHKVPAYPPATAQYSPNLSDQRQLQYYKERLALLEGKVLIYESSGDLQAKRLANRLQREIQLEKQLKELQDRVEFLESENLTLEEEKCEFEEAENDTRLRLQRLEVELEILSQRNVELEMSREALSAKYKDCRSECLNLRDDLKVAETQIHHLEKDKQKAKENLEILHCLLPLILTYYTTVALTQLPNINCQAFKSQSKTAKKALQTDWLGDNIDIKMGNIADHISSVLPAFNCGSMGQTAQLAQPNCENNSRPPPCVCQYLKEEVKCLRNQIKDMNAQHYEAMEAADSHWVELEREYKDREEAYRAKECCLKSKIQKLQECLRDDARAANEKICQLEESERELKECLLRVSKENRDLVDNNTALCCEFECCKQQLDCLKVQQKPAADQLEQEKKRNKSLNDEVSFMQKLQQETECRNFAEMEALQCQLFELKKEFLHIEVTNSELKEEVLTLEQQIHEMNAKEKECEDKVRVLQDEVKSKEEAVEKLEKRLERSEGYSLAQELGAPSKRFKREDVTDLQSASTGLTTALLNFKECEANLPSNQQFSSVAQGVKLLADSILRGDSLDDEVSNTLEPQESRVPDGCTDKVESKVKIEEERNNVSEGAFPGQNPTVGMALIPQISIDQHLLPLFTSPFDKSTPLKELCEVPSELRMISRARHENLKNSDSIKGLPTPSIQRKRKRRIHRRCSNTLHTRFSRILSCLDSPQSPPFHDVNDVEVLRRFESFHSLREDVPEIPPKVDAFTETDISRIDKGTETETESEGASAERKESSVQVDDEMNPERILNCVPSQTRVFLNMLKTSVSHSSREWTEFNKGLLKRWDTDKEFRNGLAILQKYSMFDHTNKNRISTDNYEHFVNAMSCLHVLEELFKPLKVPIMQQIEDQINEKLMNYHTKRMESEFYCTVYYPVKREKRPASLNNYEYVLRNRM